MGWIQVIEGKCRGVVKTLAVAQKKEKSPTCKARGGWILTHNITQAIAQPSFFQYPKALYRKEKSFFFFLYALVQGEWLQRNHTEYFCPQYLYIRTPRVLHEFWLPLALPNCQIPYNPWLLYGIICRRISEVLLLPTWSP